MKKILLVILLSVFLSGCSSNTASLRTNSSLDTNVTTPIAEEKSQDKYIKSSPSKDKFFINSSEGWKATYEFLGMFKEKMILYKTNDGGKTWIEVSNSNDDKSTLPGGSKSGMYFINSNIGWITTDTPREGKSEVYKTEDGGITWSEQELQIPNECKNSDIRSFPPLFFSNSDGILLAFAASGNGERSLLFYVTHDSGENWTSFVNKNIGSSDEIKWNFKVDTPENYEVTYGNNSWLLNGNTWEKE